MINSDKFTTQEGVTFQETLLKLQVSLEDTFMAIGDMLAHKFDVVILCDRGLMDGSAYVDANQWQAIRDDLGINNQMMRDNRYDGILHLVTAADGAEDFYENQTNEARYENIEQAKQ